MCVTTLRVAKADQEGGTKRAFLSEARGSGDLVGSQISGQLGPTCTVRQAKSRNMHEKERSMTYHHESVQHRVGSLGMIIAAD